MFEISCCGDQLFSLFQKICCDNMPRKRNRLNSYVDRCCGTQTFLYEQTCCLGIVCFNIKKMFNLIYRCIIFLMENVVIIKLIHKTMLTYYVVTECLIKM